MNLEEIKMQVTNYFRVGESYFFFDDNKVEDTKRAYSLAQVMAAETKRTIIVWQPTRHAGYWDDAAVVGFRSRHWLETSIATNPEDSQARHELAALNSTIASRRV